MTQIPRGPENMACPFHRKSMVKVCHTCPFWTQVRGSNPQTGQEVDSWNCAISFLPMLLVETSKEVRQGAAATESFRNEMVALSRRPPTPVRLPGIERPFLVHDIGGDPDSQAANPDYGGAK